MACRKLRADYVSINGYMKLDWLKKKAGLLG
jgi:hypothetical protein